MLRYYKIITGIDKWIYRREDNSDDIYYYGMKTRVWKRTWSGVMSHRLNSDTEISESDAFLEML